MARAVLFASEIRALETQTFLSGLAPQRVMHQAAQAVYEVITRHFPPQKVFVLCGPGNNGGDGYVIAHLLKNAGFEVTLVCDRASFQKPLLDAPSDPEPPSLDWTEATFEDGLLVVDALFGIGLNRPISGPCLDLIRRAKAHHLHVVAVDIPSGLHADTGAILGEVLRAERTVTFEHLKPGLLLMPGREYVGTLEVAPIGLLPVSTSPRIQHNEPALWRQHWSMPSRHEHKYDRGSLCVLAGPMMGASRLAVRAARRMGAGLVHLACSASSQLAYQITADPGTLVWPFESFEDCSRLFSEKKIKAVLFGPGWPADAHTRTFTLKLLETRLPCVLDAGALSSFKDHASTLLQALHEYVVLTPHEGEFRSLSEENPHDLKALIHFSETFPSVMLLKGATTHILSSGRCILNTHSSPCLATAGTGDVLAGQIAALLSQGVPPLEAACIASWVHGDAALRSGWGTIAEDLPERFPEILQSFFPPIHPLL